MKSALNRFMFNVKQLFERKYIAISLFKSFKRKDESDIDL